MADNLNPHPDALPNYDRAVIPRNKLEKYALDPSHEDGRHKAKVFKSALGFEQSHWEELAILIQRALPYYQAIRQLPGPWGRKYEVVIPITGINRRTVDVMTVWLRRPGVEYPSLITAYVVGKEV